MSQCFQAIDLALNMFHPLDIFKTNPDGTVRWLGAAEDSVAAKAYIEK